MWIEASPRHDAHWPGGQPLPEVFYDPRSLQNGGIETQLQGMDWGQTELTKPDELALA